MSSAAVSIESKASAEIAGASEGYAGDLGLDVLHVVLQIVMKSALERCEAQLLSFLLILSDFGATGSVLFKSLILREERQPIPQTLRKWITYLALS